MRRAAHRIDNDPFELAEQVASCGENPEAERAAVDPKRHVLVRASPVASLPYTTLVGWEDGVPPHGPV